MWFPYLFFFYRPCSTPGRWWGRRRECPDRRKQDPQSPTRKHARTKTESETSAAGVAVHPGEAGDPAAGGSVSVDLWPGGLSITAHCHSPFPLVVATGSARRQLDTVTDSVHIACSLWPMLFFFYLPVRAQENGLEGGKSGGSSGRGTERGRRGRGRGRGKCLGWSCHLSPFCGFCGGAMGELWSSSSLDSIFYFHSQGVQEEEVDVSLRRAWGTLPFICLFL